jgi:hypothetical protein
VKKTEKSFERDLGEIAARICTTFLGYMAEDSLKREGICIIPHITPALAIGDAGSSRAECAPLLRARRWQELA